MLEAAMELTMTIGTNDNNVPPPSNKRPCTTQPQQQASETSLQDGPADQPITPVENTESLATELEELREYKRQAEAKELEMAEAYRIAEQSRGENRERLEELEEEHEKIQDLECERLGEIQGALRAIEAQRDHARLERDEAKRREQATMDIMSAALKNRDKTIAALREDLHSGRQALYELRSSRPIPAQECRTWTPLSLFSLRGSQSKHQEADEQNFDLRKEETSTMVPHRHMPDYEFFQIAATELDRALRGPVENFSIAVGSVVLVGDVKVYWDPKTLTFRMSGTFGQSLTTQHDNDDMRFSYVNEHG
ncbi:hypothetical protein D6C97_04789 [Aureobasidium pullulans]|nr:hypothetical protein D6C97_04789 [Aureobasidium pullulans]